MTLMLSARKTKQMMGMSSSLCIIIAVTAMMPPMASDPVSPMNTCAGYELYHRNPMSAPPKAQRNITSSSDCGMYMMSKYAAYPMWLETYASIPSARHIIAEFPAHMPSMPSLRLEPLLTAMTTNVVSSTKNIHPAALRCSPRKEKNVSV